MAEVLLAVEQTQHGGSRFVTIKRIKPEHAKDADYIEFFLTEGRVALRCTHRHLPQAFELGVIDGVHYLAMEYIRGHTLLDVVRTASRNKTHVSLALAARVGTAIAEALEYIHGLCDVDGRSLRIVHRDVTPQNIMISAAGSVKLIDFGIVRSTMQTHRTQAGVVKGKFAYLAPETVIHRGRIDQRADLFALGICLYETLTGRPLFRGTTDKDTLARLRNLKVPLLTEKRSDVPLVLAEVVKTALMRQPDERFQTATEFLSSLENAVETAQIFHSTTRLRDETIAICGDPKLPTLSKEQLAILSREVTAHEMMRPANLVPATPGSGVDEDPELMYFLSQASAESPADAVPVIEDPNLAELLSRA